MVGCWKRAVSTILAGATVALAACQLADKAEPPKCERGSHVERGMCIQDEEEQLHVVLTPAATCVTISPETITVKVGETFQFENKDGVAHTIKGNIDGQTWVTAPPNALSIGMSIAKAGNWKYTVAECGSIGTVVVE